MIQKNKELAQIGRKLCDDLGYKGKRGFVEPECPQVLIDTILNFNKKHLSNLYTEKKQAVGMVWSIDNVRYNPGFNTNRLINDVFPLVNIEFEGYKYYAPKNPENYVQNIYGNIYTIPDDILGHNHYRLTNKQESNMNELIEKYEIEKNMNNIIFSV